MPTLYDYKGDPIERDVLQEEQAAPSMTGVRSVWHTSVSNALTPSRLAYVLLGVDEQNDIQDYLTLAYEMEMRELHYASVLNTRKLAVSGLEVMVEAYSDEDKHVKHRDFVADVVDDDAFGNVVKESLDALGKGFSVIEIMWDKTGSQWFPSEYKHRDARFFQFDHATRSEIRLRDESDPEGLPLDPYKYIYHLPHIRTGLPVQGGLARLAVVAYMCKGYTLKDWMAFAEVFGMPLRVGKYGDDASAAQKAALLSAVANIGTDAAAIIPESTMIEFIEASRGTSTSPVFEGLADWLDRQISKGVLGQTMTTDDGSSQSQATVHNDVRGDIMVEDAKQVSMTLRRDLVKPLVDLNFGTQPRGQYPKLRVVIEEPEDLKLLAESLPVFIDRGLNVQSSVILDKFGLPEPEEGAELLKPKGGGSATPAPTGDEEDEFGPGFDEEGLELERNKQRTVVGLMRKVKNGEPLTADQRILLATALAASTIEGDGEDEIDNIVNEELAGWQVMMDPILGPILEHAEKSTSFEQFVEGLDQVLAKMDSTTLAERLAVSTFKARGIGDASDEV